VRGGLVGFRGEHNADTVCVGVGAGKVRGLVGVGLRVVLDEHGVGVGLQRKGRAVWVWVRDCNGWRVQHEIEGADGRGGGQGAG
jgi:hypothetical protein